VKVLKRRALARKIKSWRRRLTVARVELAAHALGCAAVMTFLLSGGRARWLERLWSHADAAAAVACLVLFALLHAYVSRRIVPLVTRRFSPLPYDERRMLFDLSREARAATGIDELYVSVARRIAEALGTDDVSIFVREEASGDYLCRVSSSRVAAKTPGLSEAGEWVQPAREVK